MIGQEPWFPGFVTGSLALISVVFVSIYQGIRDKGKERQAAKTPAPPSTQQVWERLDRMERVVGASIGILSEVADQWTGEHPPVLSQHNVTILMQAGYMPPEWHPKTEEK